MIELKQLDAQSNAIWKMILEISAKQPTGWTLVGAQMVALHGFEHGRSRPRSSADADIIVDARAIQGGTRQLSQALRDLGFDLDEVSPEGVGHRFRRGLDMIDVLAPDGGGDRIDLTTIPPAHTVRVPGGTQALGRAELVEISLEGAIARISRPNLLGAILLKARAVEVDDMPDHQRQDLAFLLSLVDDPRALAKDLKGGERGWLRRRSEMLVRNHRAWRAADDPELAYLALRILADLPAL